MKGVNVHNLEIEIKDHIERHNIDIGALTFTCEGREYKMDIIQSYTEYTEDLGDELITRITCDLEPKPDREVFDECKFDFTAEDLINGYDREMTLYVGGDGEDFEVKTIRFHFDIDGQDYELKDIKEEV